MKLCDHIRAQMAFYLDDELRGQEQAAFEAHVEECADCRQAVERERRFLESVRQTRPLYPAPLALRARLEQTLSEAPSPHTASSALRQRIKGFLAPAAATSHHLLRDRRALALAACVALLMLAGMWYILNRRSPLPRPSLSEFALMAADVHTRYLRGQLPLEITSGEAEAISGWFAGKVPFSVKLPNYQEASGQEKLYQLDGARLVGFKNDYAAFVAYRMRQRPITLVVTSSAVAQPSGGEEIVSKGLKFHYDAVNGFKVITWSDRGLTYALVSDLEERGQQSCIVCHQGTKDRDFIESLKPSRSKR
jgi:anti-sigma factor RsiW